MNKLPTDPAQRKALQLYTFMFEFFPDAWLAVVEVARGGQAQHGITTPRISWDRAKSTDQMNAAFNHLFDYGTGVKTDTDGARHLAKSIWRLMAQLQLDIEAERKPLIDYSYEQSWRDGTIWDESGVQTGRAPLPRCAVSTNQGRIQCCLAEGHEGAHFDMRKDYTWRDSL